MTHRRAFIWVPPDWRRWPADCFLSHEQRRRAFLEAWWRVRRETWARREAWLREGYCGYG